jgi:chloramphenicol 3-O-phosphotransferase
METNQDIVRTIYPLNQSKVFTHEEALEMIPLLMHISAKTKRELNVLNSQLSFLKTNSDRAQLIQDKINQSLQTWSDKIRRLGAVPVSLCKVRIPGEESHYLWEYPENRLYMH